MQNKGSSINNEIHEKQKRKDPPLRRRKLVVPLMCIPGCVRDAMLKDGTGGRGHLWC